MKETFLNGKLIIKTGDLTEEESDAIVNAANKTLLGGGGVDGAIHRIGGPAILEECKLLRQTSYVDGLPTGESIITTGGLLNAKYVIHTVGPIYGSEKGREEELLKQSYVNCLGLAERYELSSISFPSISTGAFGFPKPLAAKVSTSAILSESDSLQFLETINLVFFSETDAETFLANSGL